MNQVTKDEALKLALKALEPVSVFGRVGSRDVDTAMAQEAITAIKQALAAPVQEPVAQKDQSNRCPQCRQLTLCAQCKALR
jgi:hypothetical protein